MTHTTIDTAAALVDIGIPVYKRTRYLVEAIESVLSQTFEDWRLTVLENGLGGDEIEDVVRPYLTDPRISYACSGELLSTPANWNRLLDVASGRYVTQLHDDDRWHPEWLGRRVAFLEEHEDCGFVFSPTILIDDAGEPIVRLEGPLRAGVLSREEAIRPLLVHNVVPVPSWLARRSALDAVGKHFKHYLFLDWELWVRLAAHAPVGFIDAHDNEYRKHMLQTTYTTDLSYDELMRLYAEIDATVAGTMPELTSDRSLLRRERASYLLTMAVDAFEGNPRGDARRFFSTAVRSSPRLALDTRALGLMLAMPFGRRGSRMLRSLRWNIQQRGITPHLRPKLGWRGVRK